MWMTAEVDWCRGMLMFADYHHHNKETARPKLARHDALLSPAVNNTPVNNIPRWRPPSRWASQRAASRSWPVSDLFSFVWGCRDLEGGAAAWEGVLCGPWTRSRWWFWCSWGTPWPAWAGLGAAQLHWTKSWEGGVWSGWRWARWIKGSWTWVGKGDPGGRRGCGHPEGRRNPLQKRKKQREKK